MRPTLLVVLGLAVIVGGCADDSVTTPDPVAVPAPVMTPEPAFTSGRTNTVAWTMPEDSEPIAGFEVQASGDDEFAAVVLPDDVTGLEGRFDGLDDGIAYLYRVRARTADGRLSPWSDHVRSTQDATPPAAVLVFEQDEQTSIRVRAVATADDAGSGLTELELWAARDGEPLAFHATVEPGALEYLSDAGGGLRLDLVARDAVGNERPASDATALATDVPEAVTITDQLGEVWEITNATHRYGMTPGGWAQGIGRDTIRPITDPVHLCEGDIGYPSSDEIFVALSMIDDGSESLVMPLNPMYSHEVWNDEFLGEPISMTY